MPQWIDLKRHAVALLVRKNAAGLNELVLKRLRPEADVPQAAIDYGFEVEGEIHVRRETRFNLRELQKIYPQAIVADLAMEDIVYREASPVATLAPAAAPQTPQLPEPPPASDDAVYTTNAWAYVPLPRFQREARVLQAEGSHWVEHGDDRYPVERPRREETAKAHVHRMAVESAIKMGERLPFAVLIDYPDLAYFGARKSHPSTRVGKLLSQLGIAEKLMDGETGYARLVNDPYMDLVVERLPYPDGDRLVLTHYREQGREKILDAEMVFTIRDGRLYLKETAVENVLRGGEIRSYDHYFAGMFSKNLLEQGFGQAQVLWPNEAPPAPARTEVVEPTLAEPAPTFVPITEGAEQGLVLAVAVDPAGPATLAIGASRVAAAAALEEQTSLAPGLPRQVGENLMLQPIYEDELGRRQLQFGESALLETDGDRGLEFLTTAEAKRAGQLSLVRGTPVAGALLFGKRVFRSLDDQHYAIEARDAEIYGFRLERGVEAAPQWVSLGVPWTHGAPSDNELRSAMSQPTAPVFDQAAFIEAINAGIPELNADMADDRFHLKPIDANQLVIRQPDPQSYEVRLADVRIPVEPVTLVKDDDFWRASHGSARSQRGPLETVVHWANKELSSQRRYFLTHLHRAADGHLHIGVPQAQLLQVRTLVEAAAKGQAAAWVDIGLAEVKTPVEAFHLTLRDDEVGRLVVGVDGTQRRYELFALEQDPSATLSAYEKQGVQSVREWLLQVDGDLAWEETVRKHPSGALLDQRVHAYLDYQVKHYGERFAARVPSPYAREVVLAITDGNVDRLLDTIGRNGHCNPSTAKLFQDISGRSLGTNKASREAAIYAHCGYSPDQAAQHCEQRAARKRVRMLEAEARQTIARCESYQVKHAGDVITGREFIDRLFEQGYTQLHTRTQGSVTRYGLQHPTTGAYYDLKEPLTSYVRHVLAIRASAQPAPAPELEDKLVPTT